MSFRDRQEHRWQRCRAGEQILADLDDWRATRRMREAVESLALCQTLYDLPAREPDRKETGP
ncbi:hypothetical protein ACH4A8_38980 [Streptomyces vietnamensis]|uniref:hypothetical protein n=1 Tax=Streptomyces vietnamensis TaxID=362257 RepID=UPI00378B0077